MREGRRKEILGNMSKEKKKKKKRGPPSHRMYIRKCIRNTPSPGQRQKNQEDARMMATMMIKHPMISTITALA